MRAWRSRRPLAAKLHNEAAGPRDLPGPRPCSPALRGATVNIASWWTHGGSALDAAAKRKLDWLA
eukprot:13120607-Alexandrium_andersonii.AAC.1